MQLRYFFLTILLFSVSEDFGFAQQATEWTVPEGAIAHLDDGGINDIAYSPDGGLLAAASGSGIWLYDTVTHQEVARLVENTSIRSIVFPLVRMVRRWQVGIRAGRFIYGMLQLVRSYGGAICGPRDIEQVSRLVRMVRRWQVGSASKCIYGMLRLGTMMYFRNFGGLASKVSRLVRMVGCLPLAVWTRQFIYAMLGQADSDIPLKDTPIRS